jgi:hypothetical protein
MPAIIDVYVRPRRARWSRMTRMTATARAMPSPVHMSCRLIAFVPSAMSSR